MRHSEGKLETFLLFMILTILKSRLMADAENHAQENMKQNSTLRGNLGTRSGPLCPTASKLTTQYLVLDHMNNHYTKITKAKSAIDNKPPKSIQTSQKARDRHVRDYVKKTGSRPQSTYAQPRSRPHTTTGYYHDDIYNENLWGEVDPEDEEETMIHNIMRTTLRGQDQFHSDTGYPDSVSIPQHRPVTQRPSSARSQRSIASGVSRSVVQVPSKKGTYDGDVLEKRAHVFTEEKPFTPRTLKTDRPSKLSQYKYYNKPPVKDKKKAGQEQITTVDATTQKQVVAETPPQPKPRRRRLSETREGPVTANSLMFESLRTRDMSKFNDKDEKVPMLDISMDTDHMKWIKDQASSAQIRVKNDTLKSSIREEEAYDTTVDFGDTGEMSLTYGTLGSTKARPAGVPSLGASQPLSPEDEEAKYVKFMHDVTQDVLHRGMFNDHALRQVFHSHTARRKGDLDEFKIRQMLDQIRNELNIPKYDINDMSSINAGSDNLDSISTYTGLDLDPSSHSKFVKGDTLRSHTDHLQNGTINSTMDMSTKSKVSTYHTEESRDTYNFKSTDNDELYSTIQSDTMGGTLTDTQTLKTYTATILQRESMLEEGEIDETPSEGEVAETLTHGRSGAETRVRTIEVQRRSGEMRGPGSVTDDMSGMSDKSQTEPKDGTQTPSKGRSESPEEGSDYEDDYEDDDYDDDGDDEDGLQNTEPTNTYRTDDDDF